MKKFETGGHAWFVLPASEDMPVLEGTVEAVHGDCLEIDNKYVGTVSVGTEAVHATEAGAMAAARAMGLLEGEG